MDAFRWKSKIKATKINKHVNRQPHKFFSIKPLERSLINLKSPIKEVLEISQIAQSSTKITPISTLKSTTTRHQRIKKKRQPTHQVILKESNQIS
jgi:hypothetical protein